jgi:polar amino acid transport system substrate-binding protein
MKFLDTAYLDRLPIAFYTRKGSGIRIERYEDLHNLTSPVGVLRGASYFPRFDSDPQIKKTDIATQDQLFPMLMKGNLDVFAGYVPTENYRLVTEGYLGKVEKSPYEYAEPVGVYMAVSRKSSLMKRFDELNVANNRLAAQGIIRRVLQDYYERYSPK